MWVCNRVALGHQTDYAQEETRFGYYSELTLRNVRQTLDNPVCGMFVLQPALDAHESPFCLLVLQQGSVIAVNSGNTAFLAKPVPFDRTGKLDEVRLTLAASRSVNRRFADLPEEQTRVSGMPRQALKAIR